MSKSLPLSVKQQMEILGTVKAKRLSNKRDAGHIPLGPLCYYRSLATHKSQFR